MKRALLSTALLATCVSASAITTTDTPLGVLTSGVPAGGLVTKAFGEFLDLFTFTIDAPSAASGTAVSVPLDLGTLPGLEFGIHFFSPEMGFGGIAFLDASMSALASDLDPSDGLAISTMLAAGTYKFAVLGNSIGTMGGVYTGYVHTLAVPEPETYAMLLAGLATIGFVARRRRQQ